MAETQSESTFREQVESAEAPEAPVVQQAPEQLTPETVVIEPEQPEADRAERVVPLGALHEEREKRKSLQRERDQDRANFQALQQQQIQMIQYMQQQDAERNRPKVEMPDPAQDPLGFGLVQNAQTQQEVQRMRADMARREQGEAQERQVQQFVASVNQGEQAFAAQNPDYYEAVTWARERKQSEYEAAGMTSRGAAARLQAEVVQLADGAFQRGEHPAEVGYRMARAMGFTPRQVNAQQRLNMQQEGKRAATPASAGGAGGGRVNLDSLLKMGSNDFLAATKGDAWKKLASKL